MQISTATNLSVLSKTSWSAEHECEKKTRKPGRTRKEVIQLKLMISLKLGTNVGFREKMIVAKKSVKILYSLQVRGIPAIWH